MPKKFRFRQFDYCFQIWEVQKEPMRILNFRSDVVICYKQRKEANVIDTMELIGEVKGEM
jgi:hypothetical protein